MLLTGQKISPINVKSETGVLGKVLIHQPDEGIEKVTPARAIELLYDDIVYLPKMIEEHKIFTTVLSGFVGRENVVEFEVLLADVLKNNEVRKNILKVICYLERCGERIERFFYDTEPSLLARTLITGVYHHKKQVPIFFPLPNLIFTRDLGTVVNDYLIISQSKTKARSRESILAYFVFSNHPMFSGNDGKIIGLSSDQDELLYNNNGEIGKYSVEGGDVMLIRDNHLLIGVSERTTEEGVNKLVTRIFSKKAVSEISVVYLPSTRMYMHLDTIFTLTKESESVVYEPLICQAGKTKVKHYVRPVGKVEEYQCVKDLLLEKYKSWNFISCGEGKSPFAEREQWTDACNLFVVKPGVAFAYDRNTKTNSWLKEFGYQVIPAEELVSKIISGVFNPTEINNTIISLPSSELSRARGGPHCMTMPLIRS
ncbi:MAG: arginine deiminase family protein [Cytophagaceae bacterium]